MPRDGSGASHNAVEAGENLTHGAPEGKEAPVSSGVDRSGKAAPPPEYEAGEGIGEHGGSGIPEVHDQGKGALKSTVDQEAEKASK